MIIYNGVPDNIIHLMLDPEGNSWLCFSESPDVSSRETSGLEGKKANWFPEGPDVKCFVIFLDFPFNSNKRIIRANQNSRFFNSQNYRMNDLQGNFLILSASFSSKSTD